ncbi:uncharacterized protein BT62DRAFT_930168 [Guyanagaster necrorhizus]|uniref:Uncharacterized protein n=1 Tax=Guyanagaster necrorhizus TaxID=856835 RepID=A0A9P8AU40_9AGAR|nr:uncharacterized protein BT62DRAFT_930168 [Guyanagaster necrorhizus MCA 3950]KAG7448084.1 hypothetical protein BT62DRAFT_930168 [Guyanagaster necrorhizus MCA 3950]
MLKSSIATSSILPRVSAQACITWASRKPSTTAVPAEHVRSMHASPARYAGSSRGANKRYKEKINKMHAESLDTFFRRLFEKFPSSPQRAEVANQIKEVVARISTNRVAIRSMGTLDRLYNTVSCSFFRAW